MPLIADPAAERAQRYSEFRASERARPVIEAQRERDRAALRARRRAAAAPKFTRSIVPQTFVLPDRQFERAITTDAGYRSAVEKFAGSRRAWFTAISSGHRGQIDKAARELMTRYAGCYVMALNVGIKGLTENLAERDRDIRLLQADRDRFKEERDRAFDEARESRQIPAPIKVELTLPTALPELNVNLRPSAGVELDYDAHGRVKGTRPRGTDPVTKALKKTQAGAGLVAP
jgi:hypothetical protein